MNPAPKPPAPHRLSPIYRPKQQKKNPYLYPVLLLSIGVIIAQMFWLQGNQHLFRPFSIERIKCEHCGSVGVARDPNDGGTLLLCPVCYGVGHHTIRRVDGEDRMCPACSGMGRVEEEDRSWRLCLRCEGRGLTRPTPWSTKRTEMFKDEALPR
jgi:hypothetical protein